MSTSLRDLWPDDLAPASVASPLAVLRHQAQLLKQKTKGELEARTDAEPVANGERLRHVFLLEAPSLQRAGYRLLSVEHGRDLVYPAVIDAGGGIGQVVCPDQAHLERVLADVFKSDLTRAVVHSLLAMAHETRDVKNGGKKSSH